MPGGFGGFGAVESGYTQGGMDQQKLRAMELENAGTQALGRAFQMLAPQGAMPGAMMPPGQSPPMGGPPGMPPPGAPQAPGGAMTGPAPPGGPRPMMPPGQPQTMAMPGAPPMPAVQPQPPQQPPAGVQPPSPVPAGGPPQMGGPMGGVRAPMSWQDIAQIVVRANPGAPPAVIAAAVTKALPLMTADSQQQWRLIQQQLQQQRIDQGQQRLEQGETRLGQQQQSFGERQREFDTREQRLREGLESLKDDRARKAQQATDQARQKALQFTQTQDRKAREDAFKEWDTQQRNYDRIMRAKINAATNLSGEEKKKMLNDLDAEWGRAQQELEGFKKQVDAGEQPGVPAKSANTQVKDRFVGEGGQQAELKPIPADKLADIKARLQQNPSARADVIKRLQDAGYSSEGL